VFPTIAGVTVNLLFLHFYWSGGWTRLLHVPCPGARVQLGDVSTSQQIVHVANRIVCSLSAVFHAVMAPDRRPFTTNFLYSISYLWILPFVESARAHAPKAYPLMIGVAYQTATLALVAPFFFMSFIQSGAGTLHFQPHHKKRAEAGAWINHAQSEALTMGLWGGYIIPAALVLNYNQEPWAPFVWMLGPVWVWGLYRAHLWFRPPRKLPHSGYYVVQAMYLACFLTSAIPHVRHLGPRLVEPLIGGSSSSFHQLFIPTFAILNPRTTTLEQAAADFMKWEFILASLPGPLACLWFARDSRELVRIVGWLILGSVAFGPGAAVVGVWMWRERELNGATTKHKKKKIV
jgi:hypothetical protein